ncbi:MAG: 4-deoxy-4-formamido-L-arabinose-phosphoundecaprenol deformylase, partial [Acidobacteriota bacterium]
DVPQGSAAPGWQATAHSFAVQEELGLLYHSDTRGSFPYLPRLGGRRFLCLEIPTTLPTLDEKLGTGKGGREGLMDTYQHLLRPGALNVLTVHAEVEGRAYLELFRAVLSRWREEGIRFVRLVDLAVKIRSSPSPAPLCEVEWRQLPGRPGAVACQSATVGP